MYIVGPTQAKTARWTNNINAGGLQMTETFFFTAEDLDTNPSSPRVGAVSSTFTADGTLKNRTANVTTPTPPGDYWMYVEVVYQGQVVMMFEGTQIVLVASGTIGDPTLG